MQADLNRIRRSSPISTAVSGGVRGHLSSERRYLFVNYSFSALIIQALHSRLAHIQSLYKQCSLCVLFSTTATALLVLLSAGEPKPNVVIRVVSQLPTEPIPAERGMDGTRKPIHTRKHHSVRHLAYCNLTTLFALTPPEHLDLPIIIIRQ